MKYIVVRNITKYPVLTYKKIGNFLPKILDYIHIFDFIFIPTF
jgi:hypothetical protein